MHTVTVNSQNNVDLVTRYFWNGEKLAGYSMYDAEGTETITVKVLYDNGGSPIGYIANNKEQNKQEIYTYTKNIQGDITGVCDAEGSLIVSYNYDAWGNVTPTVPPGSVSAALVAVVVLALNPLAYRGYFYDVHTGLYYLQSRFYNPMYGRFLNADTTKVLPKTGQNVISVNMFAYCNNNPVMNVDFAGELASAISMATIAMFLKYAIMATALIFVMVVVLNMVGVIALPFESTYNPLDTLINFFTKVGVGLVTVCLDIFDRLSRYTFRSNKQVHHIAPRKVVLKTESKESVMCNEYLTKAGIDINSPENKVTLLASFHSALNTNAYYSFVFDFTRELYNDGGADGVHAALAMLKLLLLTFNGIYEMSNLT